jgi:hypothetical protein
MSVSNQIEKQKLYPRKPKDFLMDKLSLSMEFANFIISVEVNFPYFPLLYFEILSTCKFCVRSTVAMLVVGICVCVTDSISRISILICFIGNEQIATPTKYRTISIIALKPNTILLILSNCEFIIVRQ